MTRRADQPQSADDVIVVAVARERTEELRRTLANETHTELDDGTGKGVRTAPLPGRALLLPRLGVALVRGPENGDATLDQLKEMQERHPELVKAVRRTRRERLEFMQSSRSAVAGDSRELAWHLDHIAPNGWPHDEPLGEGFTIGIADTGFMWHPAWHLESPRRLLGGGKYVEDDEEWDEETNGHGTHCLGLAAGPADSRVTSRVGVANGASFAVAKVFNKGGWCGTENILMGWEALVEAGSDLISFSGGYDGDGQPDPVYDQVAETLLAQDVLIVAAAGNGSRRSHGMVKRVGSPANSAEVIAVGAMTEARQVADFSSGGIIGRNGVQLAAPGEHVLSLWPWFEEGRPGAAYLSGTSMATPIASGVIAALGARTGLRGAPLRQHVIERALFLDGVPEEAQGAGMVQLVE